MDGWSPAQRAAWLLSRANLLFAFGQLDAVEETFHECLLPGESVLGPTPALWTLATGAAQALYRCDDADIDSIATRATVRSLRGAMFMVVGLFQQTIAIALHHLRGAPLDTETLRAVASMPVAPTPWREGYVLVARQLLDLGLTEPVQALHSSLADSPLAGTPFHRLVCTTIAARLAERGAPGVDPEGTWRSLLVLADELRAAPHAIDALEGIGVATALDAPKHAARLLGAAQAGREATGYRLRFPGEQCRVDQATAEIGDLLGEEAVFEALETGRTMDLPAAAAYAQRTRGERRRPTVGWESLTPTEQQVARLVTEGASNPVVAERLLMTVNTVKTHLAHIFTKLDISSRAELAALYSRRIKD